MADTKISDLTAATSSDGTEVLPIVQSATTKKLAVSKIKDYLIGISNTWPQTQTFSNIAFNGSTSGTVTIQGAAAAGTYSLTLPTSDGDPNQVLTTDGSGVLSWTTPATSGATLGANTFTATQTVTPAANTNALAVTGYSLTGSNAQSLLDLAGTWNTTGTPTAIKLNVTDTASNAASNLLDLQVGGQSKFYIAKNGEVVPASNITLLPPNASTATGLAVKVSGEGNARLFINMDASGLPNIAMGSGTSARDTFLYREAANTFAQRNSTNAQTFRIYNTFTDASNYERGKIAWSANVLQIGTEKAGTGTARALELQTDGTTRLTVEAGGTIRTNDKPLYVSSAYSTGISSSADGYFLYLGNRYGSQILQIGDNWISAGSVRGMLQAPNGISITTATSRPSSAYTTGTNDAYFWIHAPADVGNNRFASRLYLKFANGNSSTLTNTDGGYGGALDIALGAGGAGNGTGSKGADGYFAVRNQSNTLLFGITYAGLTQFGGTTSSFPALKSNSATLAVRLADDSGDADLTAKAGTFSGAVTAPNLANGRTFVRFTPLDNQPPATNFATLDTRNSIATLDFDAATAEGAVFVGVIPQGATLTSGIKVRIFWAATSATSGDCVWSAEFEKYGTDIDADSFDTATTATTTTSGTSGIVVLTEITATAIDSLAAGDQFRVRIKRDAANAADTMTGDAELIAVEVQQVA